MKRKPLKRKTGLKRTPIRRVSAKLSKELKRYYVLRDEFLSKNQVCAAALYACSFYSTQVHHMARRGKNLNVVSTWMPVCASCHEWIESHANEGREMGWLLT